ncbi:hypothetical protein Kpol_1028p50 [Vanderwaltozyma polyspora DSM 70294]|uniref:PH domain-containing protein n=1 Tax=Vanderwaltozyma polyspora (strain ATCC 22028 / DSM 70294 / BCRC 21397 / CBS 2163 / NBRC 10782 / NRRL Y-8283 / UCD 57-17) TaxID=436907 RepID=A7TG18_VANPO|nr:uncharacterized protein Kpol_1028p50 [Vanderwaltozyma polyspora DSM 70294]EDO18775.1 hypothetical protein Kpol_1028p50 [Vanderwaltozyma polyspora DSM 70294]
MATSKKDEKQGGIHLRLISVELKEASMDSPAFRASVNFFHTRVEIFEDLMQKKLDFLDTKFAPAADNFRRVYETLLPHFLPSPVMLSNGFILNQSFTPLLVDNFNKDYHEFSVKLFQLVMGDINNHSKLAMGLVNDAIEPYKQKRTNFTYYQSKYDTMLANFQSVDILQGGANSNSIMEDAFHLFDIKKSYLEASLDLTIAISSFKLRMDKFLADTLQVLKSKKSWVQENELNKAVTGSLTDYLDVYDAWIKKSIVSTSQLTADMEHVKKQLLEFTIARFTPSREIGDYTIKDINATILDSIKSRSGTGSSPEFAGWLYMKTSVGKPSRTIWVRKWCFVQNSVFGVYSLSPSKTYVEESDKFGVSLIDVRFESFSPRKFCFNVHINKEKKSHYSIANKTDNIVLTFQAENLKELKSWFTTFKNAKILANRFPETSIGHYLATNVFPPKYCEFACSSTTSSDSMITTTSIETASLLKMLNAQLTEYDSLAILNDERSLEPIYNYNMIVTPITTKFTQLALLESLFSTTNFIPQVSIVNIWGTTNWSDYSVTNSSEKQEEHENMFKPIPSAILRETPTFPESYSEKARIVDAQFKTIFYSFNIDHIKPKDEIVLFSYRSFWYPNDKQSFSTIVFITPNYVYSYMNTMGFVCLTRKNLNSVVGMDRDKYDKHLLNIYNFDGSSSKAYVYFDEIDVIEAKVKFLLENKLVMHPMTGNELLNKLSEIEQKALRADTTIAPSFQTDFAEDSMYSSAGTEVNLIRLLEKFDKEYTVGYRHVYDFSSKVILHILYGDHSEAFNHSVLLAEHDSKFNMNLCWIEDKTKDGKVQLTRKIIFQLKMKFKVHPDNPLFQSHTSSDYCMTQRIIKMINNEYYEINNDMIIIKLPFCDPCGISTKCIISKLPQTTVQNKTKAVDAGAKSLLSYYYKITFIDPKTKKAKKNLSRVEKFAKKIMLIGSNREHYLGRKAIKYYMDRIGKHGKTSKAISICGMLPVLKPKAVANLTEAEMDLIKNTPRRKGVTFDISFSLFVILRYLMKWLIFRTIKLIKNGIKLGFAISLYLISTLMRLNSTILLALVLSLIFNIGYSGKAVNSYFSVRGINKAMNNFMENGDNMKMIRVITLDKLNSLVKEVAVEDPNSAYLTFRAKVAKSDNIYEDTRNELDIKRNELLTELKMLESVEKELVNGDYRRFLLSELSKCNTVNSEMDDIWDKNPYLQSYCESCSDELKRLNNDLL